MLANLLAFNSEPLVTLFLGTAIVFFGIIILILAITIIGKIINAKKEKPEEEKRVVQAPPAPAPVVEQGIPEHVKVAIMAAIYAYYSENQEKCEFTVKKIIRRR